MTMPLELQTPDKAAEGERRIAEAIAAPLARAQRGDRCMDVFDGTYTIENRKTGQHRTFKIALCRNENSGNAGKRIVGLLSGPDNHQDYTAFGRVEDDRIHVWDHRRRGGGPHDFETYARMLWSLATGDVHAVTWRDKGATLHVAGRCLMCGRKLTVPQSILLGIGPVCLAGGI